MEVRFKFCFGAMGCGKTRKLQGEYYSKVEDGFEVIVLKPKIDKKGDDLTVARDGNTIKVNFLVGENDNIFIMIANYLIEHNVDFVLVDEAQFLTIEHINQLFRITKKLDVPVICYGLRTNFKMESFAGGKRLLEIADVLEELTTLCSCGEIARYVARKVGEIFVQDGEEIIIDGTENITYVPLCGKCYLEKVNKIDLEKVKEKLTMED